MLIELNDSLCHNFIDIYSGVKTRYAGYRGGRKMSGKRLKKGDMQEKTNRNDHKNH